MIHDLFTVEVPILEKVIRTVAVYAAIVLLFRISGKRGLASLNTFDIVVFFLLSNVVQNAIIGSDDSLLGGLIGAATLVAVNAVLNRLTSMDNRLARLLQGTDTPVITDGELDQATLRRLAIRPIELERAVRLQNGDSVDDVQTGVLDAGGQLVLTLKESQQSATRGDVGVILDRLRAIEAKVG